MREREEFARRLRRARKAQDLTQEALARRAYCALDTVKKLETGARRPSRHLAAQLAETLGLVGDERAAFLAAARGTTMSATNAAVPARLPGGTITLLMSDLLGSDRQWDREPVAMEAALVRYHAILDMATTDHGGIVVKRLVDGALAVFPTAAGALAAAASAQRALQSGGQSIDALAPARVALHSGAVEPVDGDYRGPVVSHVAQLLKVGHGGQVMLTQATAALLRADLGLELELRDLGRHRLGGSEIAEPIFQLVTSDLPVNFPALQTLSYRHQNLPMQLAPLIGREPMLAEIGACLAQPEARLITLTGPGGTGKTRLALAAAAEAQALFPDGVWFVDLAPVRDSVEVLPTIARTLGVQEQSAEPLVATLQEVLRPQRLLLILDNFEQVVAAAPELAALLAVAPEVIALVTSREVLRLAGEQAIPVPPLKLPAPGTALNIAQLSQYEAVRLFIERARAVRPGFEVTNVSAPAVAEICARLDGLPLAIELAAARTRLFAPEALLARLGRRLPLLAGGARDLPLRQQTLRGAIAWSFELLDAAERWLFVRLGLFANGCPLGAAEALIETGALEELTLTTVEALLEKSLLRRADGPGGEPRLVMLETIREYALEQLAVSGATEATQELHARYFLGLVEDAAPGLRGPRRDAWQEVLSAERENLRVALGWLVANREGERCARLCVGLWRFWWSSNAWQEGQQWLEQALELLPTADGPVGPALRAQVLLGTGWLRVGTSDFAGAEPLLAQSYAWFVEADDRVGEAEALFALARVAYGQSDPARATERMRAALAAYQAANDAFNAVETADGLSYLLLIQGDQDAAHAAGEQVLAQARAIGNRPVAASALVQLGMLALLRGELELAAELLGEGLGLLREVGNAHEISAGLNYLAELHYQQGDAASAEALWLEALELRRRLGDRRGASAILDNLARAALALGDHTRAHKRCTEGLMLAQGLGYAQGCADGLLTAGRIALAQSMPERAMYFFGAAEACRTVHNLRLWPEVEPQYQRAVEECRTALDAGACTAAWEAGHAIALEQALDLAIQSSIF